MPKRKRGVIGECGMLIYWLDIHWKRGYSGKLEGEGIETLLLRLRVRVLQQRLRTSLLQRQRRL
jgi:hypothetical protein